MKKTISLIFIFVVLVSSFVNATRYGERTDNTVGGTNGAYLTVNRYVAKIAHSVYNPSGQTYYEYGIYSSVPNQPGVHTTWISSGKLYKTNSHTNFSQLTQVCNGVFVGDTIEIIKLT